MACKKKISFKFIQDFDLFGKEPGLYYKRKEKKNSWYGSVFSIVYVTIYIGFFIYKLLRMLKKTDVTFYDSLEYFDDLPSIKLNNNIFYGGFALEHPITYDQFIDETIYYPRAFFKVQTRIGDNWNIETYELELERCQLEKFGEDFQDSTIDSLNNLYCFKDMNVTLEGTTSYDRYSYFHILFYPCKNTTENNNHCKTKEELDYYLMNTFVCFELEDIMLKPHNFEKPIMGRNMDIYYTVGKKLFQEIHIFYKLVEIQTDLEFIGFDEFPNIRTQNYIQYDWDYQMSSLLEDDIYETGGEFCSAQIKLEDEVRVQYRTYTKLISLLGDVGGLMEVILAFFKVLSSFTIDILYDTSIINNLFEFDVEKNLHLIRNKYKLKLKGNNIILDNKPDIIPIMNEPKNKNLINISNNINNDNEKISINKVSIMTNRKLKETNLLSKDNNLNSMPTSKNLELIYPKKKLKKVKDKKKNRIRNESKKNKIKNESSSKNKKKNDENTRIEKEKSQSQSLSQSQFIINKLKDNRFCIYLCCFCSKKRNNIYNVLLEEGMKIFSEKMDILRIFNKLYEDDEKINEYKILDMTDECKQKLSKISGKINIDSYLK